MTKKILLSIVFSLAAATIADAQFSTNGITASGSIGKGFIKRGGAAKAVVTLNIPAGIHANSSRPKSEFALPTSVKVKASGVKIGSVMYPPGKNKKFQFSENVLNVYDGRTPFYFIVAVPKNYKGDSVSVRATIDYQACTNEVCFPPNKQEVILTAKVR